MRKQDLESRVLDVIDRVKRREPIEDATFELKSGWPDACKTARRLGGQANAARGEPIVWIVGIDEKAGKVVGAIHRDLASWLPQVVSCFESGFAPRLVLDLNIPIDGSTIVALCFETDRAPYLVKNPDGGHIQYEVPWREGTSVRTARRSDLVRMLVPISKLPEIEVREATVNLFSRLTGATANSGFSVTYPENGMAWGIRAMLYVQPRPGERVSIPSHRCSIVLADCAPEPILCDSTTHLDCFKEDVVKRTSAGVILEGPGLVDLTSSATVPFVEMSQPNVLTLQIGLFVVEADGRATVSVQLRRIQPEESTPEWRYESRA